MINPFELEPNPPIVGDTENPQYSPESIILTPKQRSYIISRIHHLIFMLPKLDIHSYDVSKDKDMASIELTAGTRPAQEEATANWSIAVMFPADPNLNSYSQLDLAEKCDEISFENWGFDDWSIERKKTDKYPSGFVARRTKDDTWTVINENYRGIKATMTSEEIDRFLAAFLNG